MWDYRARILDVHDGDTVTVLLDLGLTVTVEVAVRLEGCWAPELRDVGGIETRDYLRQLVTARAGEWPWRVTTKRVRTDEHEVTTLGRYVATIRPAAGGLSLTDDVNAFVRAKGYGGGTGSA